jgi:hypothetical protein
MLGVLCDVIPREADDLPTGEAQELVAPAVALEGLPRAVRAKAVNLHDHAMLAPEEVDLHLFASQSHPHVHLRQRQVPAATEPQETFLQLGTGNALSHMPPLEDRAQPPNTGLSLPPSKKLPHGIHIQDAQQLCLIAGSLEGTRMHHAR